MSPIHAKTRMQTWMDQARFSELREKSKAAQTQGVHRSSGTSGKDTGIWAAGANYHLCSLKPLEKHNPHILALIHALNPFTLSILFNGVARDAVFQASQGLP